MSWRKCCGCSGIKFRKKSVSATVGHPEQLSESGADSPSAMLPRVSILRPQRSCARLAANQERRTESAFLWHPHAASTRLSRKHRADRESALRPGRPYSIATGKPQQLQKSSVAHSSRQTARNESNRVDAGGHSATTECQNGSTWQREWIVVSMKKDWNRIFTFDQ
jgi:hypothetical protein